jgi:membrane protease subunit HflC
MGILKWSILSAVVVIAAVLFFASFYVVEIHQNAVVTQFGRVVAVRTEPGLYLKTPFIQAVTLYDMRLREWDGEPGNLQTVNKKKIEVNTWARWRVTDPRLFYEVLRTESSGQGVLDGIVESSVKNVISTNPLVEVLRNSDRKMKYVSKELEAAEEAKDIQIERGRDHVVADIVTQVIAKTGTEYGLEVEGVAIKYLNFWRDVIPDIYSRMRSERIRIANLYESEGRERAATILGEMQKDLDEIESVGQKDSAIKRGDAEAEVLTTYAKAYGQDPEFYSFLRTLKLYEETLGPGTRLVLSTEDNALLRFLKSYEESGDEDE